MQRVSSAGLFAMAIGATLAGCNPGDAEDTTGESAVGAGDQALAASGVTTSVGLPDPHPNPGYPQACYVAQITTTQSGSSCTITISSTVSQQKTGCGPTGPYPGYSNPNTTTQSYLNAGISTTTSGCSVTTQATKGDPNKQDATITCSTCPSSLSVDYSLDDGHPLVIPVPGTTPPPPAN